MISVSSVIFIVALPSALLQDAFSGSDMTVGQLPEGIMEQFLDITYGTLLFNGTCPLLLQNPNVSFLLYTRNNSDNPIVLNSSNPTQIDSSKEVILLVHGWIASATAYGIPELKNAYLKRYDCNLIILDWSTIAWNLYTTSYCEVPNVASLGAKFLCTIYDLLNIPLSTIHLVGHSLGAHLCGYIGKYTVTTCGQKVGRITGLDPAGPLYEGAPANKRLDKSDAAFVDVMHTNAGQFGYFGSIGNADFNANCGQLQPGCPQINIVDIINTSVSVVACSHLRCLDYMAETVNSDNCIAKSCSSCPRMCTADAILPNFAIMGEDCSTNIINTTYWIATNANSLYCQ